MLLRIGRSHSRADVSLRLGIDTGGTFTDAVLLDPAERVVATAKALTTHHDLSLGIGAAIRAVRAECAGPVALVSLSTTLATNALVEGRGGRAGLLLIGLDERALRRSGLDRALADTPTALVRGGHRADGQEQASLDRDAAAATLARWADSVDAVAVCGQFAVRNPAHERAVAALAAAAGLPVTCSHELTSDLDAPRRALTTLLNARLIPELRALLAAVTEELQASAITAPLMVVTGDGSLVAVDVAARRPIETILSGPAASVIGAAFLSGVADAVVADVGGTTTDVAVLRDGRPRLSLQGACVAGYRTMVRAIDVRTAGLGGDSEVRREGGALVLGPRRLLPLCLLAQQHPGIRSELERQAARGQPREHDGAFLLRRVDRIDTASLGASTRRAWELLATGPVPIEEIVERQHLGRAAARLVDRGLAIAAGFTPTDAAHVLGRQQGWSVEAARLGAALAARRLGHGEAPSRFAQHVLDLAGIRTGELLLEAALAADGEAADELTTGLTGRLVARSLAAPAGNGEPASLVRATFKLALPVVAVGGPAPLLYPAPVARLGARLIVPPHHATGNAVGAVVGRVERSARVTLARIGEQVWRVHLPEGGRDVAEFESAVALAEAAARTAALNAARLAGCPEPTLVVERKEAAYPDHAGVRHVLGVTIEARAFGRPALGDLAQGRGQRPGEACTNSAVRR